MTTLVWPKELGVEMGSKKALCFFGLFLFLRRETLEQFCKLSISVDKQNLTMQKRESICRYKFLGSSAQVGQSLALGRSWDTVTFL